MIDSIEYFCYYIKVKSPFHSRQIQKAVFKLGYGWFDGSPTKSCKEVQYVKYNYLTFEVATKLIGYCTTKSRPEYIRDNPNQYTNVRSIKSLIKHLQKG
jgi:hypothetical protein